VLGHDFATGDGKGGRGGVMNKSYESDIQFPVFDLNHLITDFPLPIEKFLSILHKI
jgi:hypothetical protein